MYPFIETIRIEDGQIYNLDYHTERFNKTRAAFWKDSTPLDLREFISPPTLNGIHKCRIVYGKEVEEVTYAPYRCDRYLLCIWLCLIPLIILIKVRIGKN